MLILVLAANTSFADFPRLASFHADDAFMPKQLTKRGHRLVFSNGIIALAVGRGRARGALPGRRHPPDPALRHRRVHLASRCRQAGHGHPPPAASRSPGWRLGLLINGPGARRHRAWSRSSSPSRSSPTGPGSSWSLVPVMVLAPGPAEPPVRVREGRARRRGARGHRDAPILRRHSVLVLVDDLDRTTARAIQYARTPDARRAPCRPHRRRPASRRRPRRSDWAAARAAPRCRSRWSTARDRRHRPGPSLEVVAEELGRRRDRGERPRPPAGVHALVAPPPPRPHRRLDRQGRRPGCPTPTSPSCRTT